MISTLNIDSSKVTSPKREFTNPDDNAKLTVYKEAFLLKALYCQVSVILGLYCKLTVDEEAFH